MEPSYTAAALPIARPGLVAVEDVVRDYLLAHGLLLRRTERVDQLRRAPVLKDLPRVAAERA